MSKLFLRRQIKEGRFAAGRGEKRRESKDTTQGGGVREGRGKGREDRKEWRDEKRLGKVQPPLPGSDPDQHRFHRHRAGQSF